MVVVVGDGPVVPGSRVGDTGGVVEESGNEANWGGERWLRGFSSCFGRPIPHGQQFGVLCGFSPSHLQRGAVRQLRNARGNPPGLGVGGQPAVIMAGRCGEGGAGSGLPNFHGESFTSTLAVDAGGCGASGLLDSFQCLRDFSQVGTLVRLSAME